VIDPLASAIFAESLRDGLQRAGYSEGKNIVLEWRGTAETDEELQGVVDELARSKVDVLVTVGTPATRAALQRTALPVIFSVGDPVVSGFASSLAKPGGNGTGVSSLATDLEKKRVQVIHQLVPKARRIGLLANPANPLFPHVFSNAQGAARTLGVELKIFPATNPRELDEALRRLGEKPPDALLVAPVSFYVAHAAAIAQAVRKARIPTLYPFREYLIDGGLAAYGVDLKRMGDIMASYVDKVLKGAKPGDLPIEQMSKYDLVIDLRVAREMGIRVPQDLLYRADELIR
jgi:putative ABC transport system substrate-binding protein